MKEATPKPDSKLKLAIEKAKTSDDFIKIIKSLSRNNQKLLNIANGVPAIIAYVDKDLIIQFHNKKYSEWFNLDSKNITGRHVEDVIGSEQFNKAKPFLLAALDGEHQEFSREYQDETGKIKHVNAIYTPHTDGNSNVIGLYALVVDITEMKIAEATLHKISEQQRFISDLGNKALSGIDFSELIEAIFKELPNLISFDICEVLEIIPNDNEYLKVSKSIGLKLDDSEKAKLHISKLTENAGFSNLECLSREFSATGASLFTGVLSGIAIQICCHKTPFGIFAIQSKTVNEYTEDDKAFIRAIANTLSAAIERDNTDNLLNDAINQAERSSKAKSAYLANMSHEIRTPMNGVIGMIELIRETNLDATQLEYLEVAHRSAETLLSLINNVLDLSKIETGNLELENVQFNISNKIRNTTDLFIERAKRKGLYIKCNIADDIPALVEGDPTRLSQVITNLIGNALKFTSTGGINVELKKVLQDDDSITLKCEVTDTGIGISDEAKTQIFEAFSQAEKSTTREFGGTGLGLSISKQIVELMNGNISVKNSETGNGTTFFFTVNLKVPRMQPGKPFILEDEVKRLKILLVGDDLYQSAAVGWIKNWGADIDIASTGLEAVSIISEQRESIPISVIVVSTNLPGMSNDQFIQLIKRDKENSSIRIVNIIERHEKTKYQAKEQESNDVKYVELEEQNLLHALANAPVIETKGEDKSEGESEDSSSKKILIVEDNPVNQKVTSDTLKKLGYETKIANNGQEGLNILENEEFDLILMDCQMPILDGYQATEKIRKKEKSTDKHIPIIATTAHAMQGDKEKCIASGMDDYLAKPIRMQALREKIEFWFEKIGK